jgi:hypothetical protein
MIAFVKQPTSQRSQPAWHEAFLKMLPAIKSQARWAFRKLRPEERDEAIQEVVANCAAAFARLVERKKQHVASASSLARFAVAQFRDGRRVTGRKSPKDALSSRAQFSKRFKVEWLDYFDGQEGTWQDIVVEDHRVGPAEIAACRIDFAEWLKLLPRRLRKIALTLASGETTSAAAKKFGVTAARISQLRLWLKQSWEGFQGEQLVAA